MKGEASFLEVFKFIGILFAILIGVFCIAVVLAVIFGKTAWLRLPEETAEQKARRGKLQRRTELMAKAFAVGASGNSVFGAPLSLMIVSLSKLRSTRRTDSNKPLKDNRVEREPKETERKN